MLLLVASESWTTLFPTSRTWSAEQHQRLVELSNQATDLKQQLNVAEARPSIFAGENPAELLDRFKKVDAEYKRVYAQFKIASEPSKPAPKSLRWAGIALIVAGAVIVFVNRDA